MAESSLVPGETRIRDVDGFCGTVDYVGPVASAKKIDEVYAGIVWDDPSRGKHDGSVLCRQTQQLVRHFSCGSTQGSFLRLHKMDRGVTLTSELLRSKYVEMQAPIIAPNNLLPHTARTSSGLAKPIEFLGELKIRGRQQLEDIHKVSLRREGISRASDEDLLTDFGNIRDIDLAGNLLCNWKEVFKIIQQFPALQDFSAAYNRLRDIHLPVMTLDRIKVLNLNSCSIRTCQTMQWIADSMPNLESLCIANSDLSDIESYEIKGLQRLKLLDCSSCQLSSWENQVLKFAQLPKLVQLSLDDNPIPSIPKSKDVNSLFPSLLSLQFAGTAVNTWMDLEGINSMLVTSLRLKNTPLTSTLGQGEVRFLSVARFPGLDYFNASVISKQESVEAERRYVSLVANLLSKLDNESEEKQAELLVSEQHPQYPTLREKHKSLIIHIQNQNGGSGSSNLASSVCNVTIASMAASSCSMEPLIRRLPGSLTVGRLKALCARAFGLDVDLMTLHFRTEVRLVRLVLPVATSYVLDEMRNFWFLVGII
jgi:Leucine-rich repeat (LRR) protein